MKTAFQFLKIVLILAALSASCMVPGSDVIALEEAGERIKTLVERSQLQADERAGLLASAGRALRAGIPAADVEIILARARQQRIAAGLTRELLDTAAGVREKGLPLRPVLSRIEQGLSKGVPPERISAASRTLAEKLAEAQPIVNNLIRDGVKPGAAGDREYAVETVARALEKSMAREVIVSAGERVKERGGSITLFDKAVHSMTRLIEKGLSAESASRLVNSAVGRGFSEKDLLKIERIERKGFADADRKDKGMDNVSKEPASERRGERREEGRREELRDDQRGGSREPASDRARDTDRGGKGRGR